MAETRILEIPSSNGLAVFRSLSIFGGFSRDGESGC